jgi:hypothetical protein
VLPVNRVERAAAPDRRRWVSPEPLNVAPALVGLPLASPSRRALAVALDLAVIALLSDVSGFWLLAGLALVALQLRSRRGGATRGPRWVVGWMIAALVVLLALQQAGEQWQRWRQPVVHGHGASGLSAGDADEADAGDAESAAADARAAAATASAALGSSPATAFIAPTVVAALDAAASAAAGAESAAASAASAPQRSDAQRIAQLEAELAEARRPKPLHWRERLGQMLDDLGAGLGWGIVYFSLLPAWWGGQTVGKKLFGLRVVELTGKPMTVMRCLKRYGGYAAGVATGGLGFVQALWDPNRQAIQDKTAHTVVIDLRALARVRGEEPEAADGGVQSS